jgi:ubiquinone/menaquinone biosynthesis C-methylase UbiE
MGKERDLIKPGILRPGGTWADIGSGIGYFTLPLCDLLGPTAEIYSVDRDGRALERQERALTKLCPQGHVHYLRADFTQPLTLPPLDGMVMANALHFVKLERQEEVLRQLCTYLKPGGTFIIVEYEARSGNPWVPYPVNYESFEYLAEAAGLRDVRRIAAVPSSFLREMYAAQGTH